ncbi:hypothetical protein BEWA_035490 [Theileria equi strain WA]|uniref:Signal peptide containing protein n=1 Tax=Theileria equi strain WA TaxID=1537102 RepID=L1LEB4_THEEQ|nr:hypothetical protein BEWA_035490 [Theileria equi strain WA]EKX73513.1 hypothetical protein BEWA_035490 [Theileria equi strain WA]|eukprot:XP_004832965.1 hypothetical protein BEWA_035490 [Theileria equi strain WA]
MKVIAVLWTVCLVRLCSAGCCGCFGRSNGSSVTLDLSCPDESKVKMTTNNDKGLESKEYSPKSGSKIKSVVDNGATIWDSCRISSEQCLFATLSKKGESSLLLIATRNAVEKKYFEKCDEKWKKIDKKDDYEKKLNEMRGESGSPSPNPSTTPSTSSK